MASNLIVKLLLEDKDFAGKFKKNREAVLSFNNVGNTMLGVVGKFAGAFGLAMGGAEAFNKAMQSSQTIADNYASVMHAAQVSVDNFFYSVMSGDFSPFLGGLDAVISRAREAYAALDDLGNVTMSYNYASAQDAAKLQTLMNVARDTGAREYDRRVALNEAKALQAQMRANAEVYRGAAMEALRKELQAASGVTNGAIFTDEMIDRVLRLDISSTRGEERQRLAEGYNMYEANLAALNMLVADAQRELSKAEAGRDTKYMALPRSEREAAQKQDAAQARETIKMLEGEILALQKRYSEEIAYNAALVVASDEKLNEYGQRIIVTENALRSVEGQMRSIQTLEKRLDGSLAAGKGSELKAEAHTKEYNLSDFDASLTSHSWEEAFRGEQSFKAAQKAADEKRWAEMGIPGTIEGGLAIPDLPEWEEELANLERYNEGIGTLGNSFAQLGNAIGGTEGALLSWMGSAMQNVAQIATTIAQLTAEAAARKANATAAATEAGAKAMSAHAGIPFAGVAMGVGAVATIVATLMSMPKFAEGGVVTGPTIGLVGEAGPEAIIPLAKLEKMMAGGAREVRVVGTLRARGKDLVGTISNYENVQKVR